MIEWPEWCNWDLELSQHVLKRIVDRQFNEVDLRQMLELATAYRPNHEEGRWAIETRHAGDDWVVVVEPRSSETILLVITAYQVG
jgi:hypothetical protein